MNLLKYSGLIFAITLLGVVGNSPAQAEPIRARLAAVPNVPLALPHDLTLTPDGQYLVAADMGHNRVVLLDSTTLALRHVIGEGFMSYPHDVTFDPQGRLLVADSGNHRLIVFDGALPPLYEISTWDPPFSEPKYISVNPQGEIFVADQYNNAIRVFSAASEQLGQFAYGEVKMPEGVYAKDDRIWVSDSEGGRILLYQRDIQN